MAFWEWFLLLLVFVPLVMMWGVSLVDIFMRSDLSGVSKALWVIGLMIFPWVGVLVYVLVRPPTVQGAWSSLSPPTEAYPQTSSLAQEIERLASLRSQGALTDDEFAEAKAKLLATSFPGSEAA